MSDPKLPPIHTTGKGIGIPNPAEPAMAFYAHTATQSDGSPDPDESHWQPLADHLRNVAELAAGFGASFGASDWARLAGQWHDLGKYSAEFQR